MLSLLTQGAQIPVLPWIGPVLQKEKKFQVDQQDSWNKAGPSTTPLPVVETMEEREIPNSRIARNTLWNPEASGSPALQAGPSNYNTVVVASSSQNRLKKWDTAMPTPINTNLPYNHPPCAFCKQFDYNVQTCIEKRETLNDLKNGIYSSLNNIIDSRLVPNG